MLVCSNVCFLLESVCVVSVIIGIGLIFCLVF